MAENTVTHTPRPWKVVTPMNVNHYGITAVRSGEHIEIARIRRQKPGERPREALANAKLIAAAPELLEALTTLVADYDNREVVTDPRPRLIEARAAIEAATS